MTIMTEDYEYNLKINTKNKIVLKARFENNFYFSPQIDKFNSPSCKNDSMALIQRVKSWRKCKKHNHSSWWCSQDHDNCPVCDFQQLLDECENEDKKSEECILCGTAMSRVYTGRNRKTEMPDCSHSVCQSCMDGIIDTSAVNAPELDGYKINCPFCRAENIIKYD